MDGNAESVDAGLPVIDGRYLRDDRSLENYSRDFGGIFRRRPSLVALPRNALDVSKILRYASSTGLTVSIRGRGHSMEGQSLNGGGIVLATEDLRMEGGPRLGAGGGQVTVGAGETWRGIVATQAVQGYRIPVLPDFIGMSLGGSLSAGGIGKGSHAYGTQMDLVTELLAVTGAGDIVRCSRSRFPDLFHALLGGMGQLGIITEATLERLPLAPFVLQTVSTYPGPAESLDAVDRACAGNCLCLSLQLVRTRSSRARVWAMVECHAWFPEKLPPAPTALGRTTCHEYREFVGRIDADPEMKRRLAPEVNAGQRSVDAADRPLSQPWFDAFLSRRGVEIFLRSLDHGQLDPDSSLLVVPIRARERDAGASLFQYPDQVAAGDLFYGVIIMQSAIDRESRALALKRNEEWLERVLRLGGRNYAIDNIQNPAHWERHLGPAVLKSWAKLKGRFDPRHTLSGIGIPNGQGVPLDGSLFP